MHRFHTMKECLPRICSTMSHGTHGEGGSTPGQPNARFVPTTTDPSSSTEKLGSASGIGKWARPLPIVLKTHPGRLGLPHSTRNVRTNTVLLSRRLKGLLLELATLLRWIPLASISLLCVVRLNTGIVASNDSMDEGDVTSPISTVSMKVGTRA